MGRTTEAKERYFFLLFYCFERGLFTATFAALSHSSQQPPWDLARKRAKKRKNRKKNFPSRVGSAESHSWTQSSRSTSLEITFDTIFLTFFRRCGHYFCERCAFNYDRKSKKCAVCGQSTMGIFNVAHKLVRHLKQEAEKKSETASGDGITIES